MRAISLVLCLVLIAIWGPSITSLQPAAAPQEENQEDQGKIEEDQTQETEEEAESQEQGRKEEEKGEVSKREEYSDRRVKCGNQKCVSKPKEANNQIWCEDVKDECDADSGKPCKCELFSKSKRTDDGEARWLLVTTEGIKVTKVKGENYSCFCVRGK